VADISGSHAVLALQGAASWSIVERCLPGQNIAPLPYYGFRKLDFSGNECWLARIGYCGETGCELVIADAAAPVLWQALLTAGAGAGLTECGFDAIDTLRIEAGHILFTRELATPVTPFELGLARLVDFYRPPFRGAQPLRAQRWREPARRMVGVVPASRAAMSQRLPAHIAPGNAVATSTCWSPVLGCNLGIGFVNAADARPGALLRLADGVRARVARLPFYDPAKYLPRRTP
jgi:aminomethyltransferase